MSTPSPLRGYRIGVTAARKADEQIALLHRRGAEVEWAAALSVEPNRINEAALRAATEQVLGAPVDLFVATTGIGVKSWFRGRRVLGAPAPAAGRAGARPRSWPAGRSRSARCAERVCASCGHRSRSASRTCSRTCAVAT